MKIMPSRDHVLVVIEVPKTGEVKTKSGIVLHSTKQKPQCIGTVEAVGTGRILNNGSHVPMSVEVGNKVLFYDYVGTIVEQTNDVIRLLIKENDIMAIIED